MADYLNIAGRVRTTASDGVAMEAQEVKDLNQNKSQQEINADVQTELGDRYTKQETYSKEQLDELITTPDVNYVSVVATDATTAVTDILPATGEANTIYRVGNWNGTQYDPTMYALYAWNGSAYVCLAVRSFVGEVYDISVNHPDGQGNPTPYADLTAALGTNGANIPADIRRGGMRIQFIQGTVQSSDNKYVQARCMADEFTTDVTQWQCVDIDNKNKIFFKIVDSLSNAILSLYSYLKVDETGRIKTKKFDSDNVVEKEAGKGLSTNDFNNSYKERLDDFSIDNDSNSVFYLKDANGNILLKLLNYLSIANNGRVKTKTFDSARIPVDIVVDANGNGDYTTIEDALANADDSATKHIIILVKEGVYYPAIKISGVAPYRETGRNLTIIGENKNKCILRNDIGFYDYTIGTDCAILRLGGNVTIKDLTFLAYSSEYSNYIGTPGFITERTNRKASYCIHRDGGGSMSGDVFLIDNCILIDDHFCPVGMGLEPDVKYIIKDCFLQGEQASTDSIFNGYGTIYAHFAANLTGLNQDLEVINCQIVNKTSKTAVCLLDSKSSAATPADTFANFKFIGNSIQVYNAQGDSPLMIINTIEGFYEISPLSKANNCASMNVAEIYN